MSGMPMKSYWMGEDIDTLPRERLIEIIHHLGEQIAVARRGRATVLEIHCRYHALRGAPLLMGKI